MTCALDNTALEPIQNTHDRYCIKNKGRHKQKLVPNFIFMSIVRLHGPSMFAVRAKIYACKYVGLVACMISSIQLHVVTEPGTQISILIWRMRKLICVFWVLHMHLDGQAYLALHL